MSDYRIAEDLELIQELLDCSRRELAREISRSVMTLNRWAGSANNASVACLDDLYGYAYRKGIRLNEIKAQLYREEHSQGKSPVLFHGSKQGIIEPLSLDASHKGNDFGQGFYCGENLRQAAMFVARFPQSSLYMLVFDPQNLKPLHFEINQNWMLTVAYFRGRLGEYADHPRVVKLCAQVDKADYIIAPIADNRMFEVIDSFVDGEITDIQCQHCLSATNLGKQYVFTSEQALKRVHLLEQCFLCREERDALFATNTQEAKIGIDKSKIARKQYRNQGSYIEELLT